MQIAINSEGNRITPSASSQRAFCPLCNGNVIGKCGEIYNWHWQHVKDRDCDPWQEHETAWHREWKAQFPIDWQERILQRDGIKHRADILTPQGVVIEFQNSPISGNEIREREAFYGEMFWVVNAEGFRDNLHLRSVVKSKLAALDERFASRQKDLEDSYRQDLDEIDKKIKDTEDAIRIHVSNQKYQTGREAGLRKEQENVESLVEEQITAWGKKVFNGIRSWRLDECLDVQNKALQAIKNEWDKLKAEMERLEASQNAIENLKTVVVDGKLYKAISFEALLHHLPRLVVAVEKDSLNSLFLQPHPIQSVKELHAYQYKKERYVFAFEPTEKLNEIAKELAEAENVYTSLNKRIAAVRAEMLAIAKDWFKVKLSELERRLAQMERKRIELEASKVTLEKRKAQTQRQIEAALKELENEQGEHLRARGAIMRENKGLYSFYWVRERASWKQAKAPLFFDFGEGFLYERIDHNLLRKCSIEDFICRFSQEFKI